MAYYGYHRTSTKEQHLDRGIIEIQRFCESQKIKLTGIFTDKLTGKTLTDHDTRFWLKMFCEKEIL